MCNLYSSTMPQDAMRQLFAGLDDRAGNLEGGRFFPDQMAPVIRHGENGLELVPLISFAEPRGKGKGNQWFAIADDRPMFFVGIECRGWTSVRKIKDGETVDDLYAFLTTPPNAEVKPVHPKAMPVILTEPDEWEARMDGLPAAELQRPLWDGTLPLTADRPSPRKSRHRLTGAEPCPSLAYVR